MNESIGTQISATLDNVPFEESSRRLYSRIPPPPYDYDIQAAWEFPLIRTLSDRIRIRAESLRMLRERR